MYFDLVRLSAEKELVGTGDLTMPVPGQRLAEGGGPLDLCPFSGILVVGSMRYRAGQGRAGSAVPQKASTYNSGLLVSSQTSKQHPTKKAREESTKPESMTQ
jgi:hypothetical protein